MKPRAARPPVLHYRDDVDLVRIGVGQSRQRQIVRCNQQLLNRFNTGRDALGGHSFDLFYPTHEEFERTGARLAALLIDALTSELIGK